MLTGDSIQNILGDVTSCALGYILGTVFLAIELQFLSVVWILVSEVVCVLYMRDSLVMTVITVFLHSERIKTWQCSKIPCEDKRNFISRLWRFSQKPCQC